MDNLSKNYKKELFEYYKSKCQIIDINNRKNKVVRDFIKFHNIEDEKLELIKNIISTPIIIHEAYETKNGFYYLSTHNTAGEFRNLEDILFAIFSYDIKSKNPMYEMIKSCNEYYIEDLKMDFEKMKIRKKIKGF